MVCPYCHKEIKTVAGKCPKCFAELPQIAKKETVKAENKEEK
jgi:predicted amidophosphoribosyltransferase